MPSYRAGKDVWIARARDGGRNVHLGTYATRDEALNVERQFKDEKKAYDMYAREIGLP